VLLYRSVSKYCVASDVVRYKSRSTNTTTSHRTRCLDQLAHSTPRSTAGQRQLGAAWGWTQLATREVAGGRGRGETGYIRKFGRGGDARGTRCRAVNDRVERGLTKLPTDRAIERLMTGTVVEGGGRYSIAVSTGTCRRVPACLGGRRVNVACTHARQAGAPLYAHRRSAGRVLYRIHIAPPHSALIILHPARPDSCHVAQHRIPPHCAPSRYMPSANKPLHARSDVDSSQWTQRRHGTVYRKTLSRVPLSAIGLGFYTLINQSLSSRHL